MRNKIYILTFIALFIILGSPLFIDAQEDDQHVDIVVGEKTEEAPEILIVEPLEPGESVIVPMAEEDRSSQRADEDRRNNRERRAQRSRRDAQAEGRFGEPYSRESRRTARQANPDIRERVRESPRDLSSESSKTVVKADGEPSKRPGPRGSRAEGDEKLQRYINAIVNKNLFLPIGSGRRDQKPSYTLTAVISNTSENPGSKAIIEQVGSQKSYYVSEGEVFADGARVVDIEERQVKIDRAGEEIALRLGEGTQGGEQKGGPRGGREGPRGGFRPAERGERPPDFRPGASPSGFNPDDVPPFVRKMLEDRGISMEEVQKNPQLQEKLRAEFEERFRKRSEGE